MKLWIERVKAHGGHKTGGGKAMFKVVRTEAEIERVWNWASGSVSEGKAHFANETYESGLEAAFRWLSGEEDTPPDAA